MATVLVLLARAIRDFSLDRNSLLGRPHFRKATLLDNRYGDNDDVKAKSKIHLSR